MYVCHFFCPPHLFFPGGKLFSIEEGDKHFFVGGSVSFDDVEEMEVSEANTFSAGARMFKGQ